MNYDRVVSPTHIQYHIIYQQKVIKNHSELTILLELL